MELVVGLVVAERFRLERELGVGGMGVVWAATHLITNKKVALKFMHANSDELTARFVREAQTASAVRHPNVVDIHDVLPLPDGTPLMVMEMLTGEALAEKLTRETKLSPVETAQIMGPVVSAVAAAHAAGIVHRDLKPENIFLARYGTRTMPKVLDFGIAKLMPHMAGGPGDGALTRTGSLLGTPYYMSPEQAYGEKDVDVRADVWALGVILYQCLTGARPFEGDNFGQLLKSVTSGRFEPIESLAPWVPAQLSDVVVRMLRERNTRLADLDEVEAVLVSIAGASSSPTLPYSSHSALPSNSSGRLPVTTPSAGFMLPQGPPGAPPSGAALTPSPMVRSQTLLMSPNPPDTLPVRSSMGIKVAIGVFAVALLVGGGTYAARHTALPAAAGATAIAPAPPTAAATAPALPTLTPSVAAIPSTTTATTAIAAVPRASAKASSAPGTGPVPHSSARTSADPTTPPTPTPSATHTTGGLSTAVPF